MSWFKKTRKEPIKLPKNRECPYCKKEIDADAIKCPYCQSNVMSISQSILSARRNKSYQIILLIILTPIVLLTLISLIVMIFRGDNLAIPQISISPTPQVKPQVQQPLNNEKITYQKVTLAELQDNKIPESTLVETSGIIVRKIVYNESEKKPLKTIFILIKDADKFALVMPFNKENLTGGDKILVKAFYISNQSISQYWELDNYLKSLPLPKNIPIMQSVDVPSAQIKGITILSKSSVAPANTEQSIPPLYNWSNFSKINFSDYVKNPPAYLNQQIKFSGLVTDFLAAGDRGGDTNFIAITDYMNPLALKIIMLRIDNSSEYKKATASLNATADLIVVYGTGAVSQTSTNDITVPVVKVLRLDKCNLSASEICADGQTQILFP